MWVEYVIYALCVVNLILMLRCLLFIAALRRHQVLQSKPLTTPPPGFPTSPPDNGESAKETG
jgi:hypothetical protein